MDTGEPLEAQQDKIQPEPEQTEPEQKETDTEMLDQSVESSSSSSTSVSEAKDSSTNSTLETIEESVSGKIRIEEFSYSQPIFLAKHCAGHLRTNMTYFNILGEYSYFIFQSYSCTVF